MNENLDPSAENLSENEREFENNLRPISFNEFSGQEHVINNLKIFVEAAYQRNEAQTQGDLIREVYKYQDENLNY